MSGTIIVTAAAGDATGALGFVASAFPEDTVGDQRKSGNQADDATDDRCADGKLFLFGVGRIRQILQCLSAGVKGLDFICHLLYEAALMILGLLGQSDRRMAQRQFGMKEATAPDTGGDKNRKQAEQHQQSGSPSGIFPDRPLNGGFFNRSERAGLFAESAVDAFVRRDRYAEQRNTADLPQEKSVGTQKPAIRSAHEDRDDQRRNADDPDGGVGVEAKKGNERIVSTDDK